ncbi:MAG TPA: diacylglycerol kinase family lipid kinase, partial [Stellaceae bacterium]|nr:diacylglycerol kinase family lipid kinase [Stellaceae bacterium]
GYMAAMAVGLLPRCPSVRIVPARQVRLIDPPGAAVQIDGDVLARLPVTLRIAATPLQLIQPLP